MKKIGFFISILVLFNTNIVFGHQYQSIPTSDYKQYHSFIKENAFWLVYSEISISENPTDTSINKYIIGTDKVINDITYKELLLSKDGEKPKSFGALREEGKKVYYVGEDFMGMYRYEEMLLYDFDAKPGDRVYHDGSIYTDILNIDSVWVDGEIRKRYEVHSLNEYYHEKSYWIEGIGSITEGLLTLITAIPTCCYHYWEHIGYSENGKDLVTISPIRTSYESIFDSDLTRWVTFTREYDEIFKDSFEVDSQDDQISGDTVFHYINGNWRIYEDTNTGKVWLNDIFQNDSDYLVMDMTLEKGDTFLIRHFFSNEPDSIITVDTTYYLNDQKIIEFDYYLDGLYHPYYDFKLKFMEGIGTTFGMLYQLPDANVRNYGQVLLCSYKGDLLTYSSERFNHNCDFYFTGIDENSTDQKDLKLFPNPLTSQSIIRFEQGEMLEGNVSIYNGMGQKIYSTKTQRKDIILHRSDFPETGIYMVKFIADRKIYFTKFLVE